MQMSLIVAILFQPGFASPITNHFINLDSRSNGCIPGDLVENALDCHYYWQCEHDGSETLQKCDKGFAFINGRCVEPTAPCSISRHACNGLEIDSILPNLESCQNLWICKEHHIEAASCPSNTTINLDTKKCSQTYPCSDNVCLGLTKDARVAVTDDCSAYWQCSQNGAILKFCPEGHSFNPIDLECQPSKTAGCPVYKPFSPDCADALPGSMVAGEYCDQFYICSESKPIKYLCDSDLVFNAERGYCVTADMYSCVAPVNPCKNRTVGSLIAVESSCSSYLVCLENGPARTTCPDGYEFSSLESECLPAEEAGCSVTATTTSYTTSTTEEGTTTVDIKKICMEYPGQYLVPYPEDCSKFVTCVKNAVPNVLTCPKGLHFTLENDAYCTSPEKAKCETDYSTTTDELTTTEEVTVTGEISSTSTKPTEETSREPTTTEEPAETSTTTEELRTTEEVNATEEPTTTEIPTTIEEPTKVTTTEVSKSTDEITTTEEATTTETSTEEATTAEESTTQQQPTTTQAELLENACKDKNDGLKIEYPGDCQKYITCSSSASWEQCPDNEYFSSKSGVCGTFDSSQCALANISCQGSFRGEYAAIPGECNKYVICSKNPIVINCKAGEKFDTDYGCVSGVCDV